jgi:hypothetical protein
MTTHRTTWMRRALVLAWTLCVVTALFCVVVAFMGAEAGGAFVRRYFLWAGPLALALLVATFPLTPRRHRWDAIAIHLGCILVLAGALAGGKTPWNRDRIWNGYVPLAEGDRHGLLFTGDMQIIGSLPFELKLEKFTIDYYPLTETQKRAAGGPTVREYRSLVTVLESNQPPRSTPVRVNHPLRVGGWQLFQNSWQEARDPASGRRMYVSIRQAVYDPGLPVVYAGFISIWLGALALTLRALCASHATRAIQEAAHEH